MPKDQMIEALGERKLLLPSLVSAGLRANDQVKYLLALLQAARTAAEGSAPPSNLREERLASGVMHPELDRVVAESRRVDSGTYRIPEAESIVGWSVDAVDAMLTPLEVAEAPAATDLRARLARISDALHPVGDEISQDELVLLTAARRPGVSDPDSLHLLVMDAHRELNRLQGQIATESIDGAAVHGLAPGDEELVRAFMAGVHATERLRFDLRGSARPRLGLSPRW